MNHTTFGECLKNKRIKYGYDDEHLSFCDVDKIYGGLESYPAPRDIFSASIGLCVLAVLAIYIETKLKESAEGLKFESNYFKTDDGRVSKVCLKVKIPRQFESRREELIKVAESCPIKRTLKETIEIETLYEFT